MDILAMVRRQWIAVIAVLAISGASGVLVIVTTPTSYESGAVIAVLPSSSGKADQNPYFTSPEALSELASLTIQVLDSPQKRQELQEQGLVDYTLDNEGSSSSRSAAIFVTAVGDSPDAAAASAVAAVTATAAELDQIQEFSGISQAARATVYTVVQPEPGTPNAGARVKAGVAVALVVFIVGMIVVAVIDSAQRRRSAPSATQPRQDQPDDGPATD
jgi:uncharacterized protein involved in exopolysaccharide biosynthesis